MNYEKIGLFIKDLREKNNLSQNDLALKLNISRQAISKWERGITIPDASTLVILSDIFQVSINEILAGSYLKTASDADAITLEVLEDKQKLKNVIKKFILVIVLLFLAFFIYYFMNSYDSFKVYMVNGKYQDKDLFDGMMVQAENKLILKVLKLNDNVIVKDIKLYYVKDNKEKILYENKSDTALVNFYGINTYVNRKDLKVLVNNLYVKFNGEVIKLEVDHEYSNTRLIVNISSTVDSDKLDTNTAKIINTLEKKYPFVDEGYLYESNKYKVLYNKKLKVITLKEEDKEYIYDLINNILYYKDNKNYFIKSNDDCVGRCDNNLDVYHHMMEVLNETIFD